MEKLILYLKQGIFKDKSKYPTLTRMSYCQCRLKLVFASIFRQFGYRHVALLLDRSDLFSLTVGAYFVSKLTVSHSEMRVILASDLTGKNLEYGLRQEGVLSFVRELDGNDEEQYESYLKDASLYARGKSGVN